MTQAGGVSTGTAGFWEGGPRGTGEGARLYGGVSVRVLLTEGKAPTHMKI